MNISGMTVRMNLGRHDFSSDFELLGSTADLACICMALENADEEKLPPNAHQVHEDLKKLLRVVQARNADSKAPDWLRKKEGG